MELIFHCDQEHHGLKPLTWTRPVSDLRIGILTISEKWSRYLSATRLSFHTADHLAVKYPLSAASDALHLRGGLLPSPALVAAVQALTPGQKLVCGDQWLAHRQGDDLIEFKGDVQIVQRPHQIFQWNATEMDKDFDLLTAGRRSQKIASSNTLIGDRIFLEPGAKVEASVLNATDGPIYLAIDSEIMEGCLVRGGLALGENSQLKMGAKVYGSTTIGPYCKVGGEVNNSVFWGYSSKAHEGFLGNSVIGQWCNLGADTNNSNLKNDYGIVKQWHVPSGRFLSTGLQFCGLIMGDHSKSGINTMFNTATVIGVSCNVFGSGFPRSLIADFSWGGASGQSTYRLDKALITAELVLARRDMLLDAVESDILSAIFAQTAKNRGGTGIA
ncbi:MAG: GlmU family protein [Schleiferiaceae bacterium]|nr:GlmU family protein [Schleiferiaceae bacterium]